MCIGHDSLIIAGDNQLVEHQVFVAVGYVIVIPAIVTYHVRRKSHPTRGTSSHLFRLPALRCRIVTNPHPDPLASGGERLGGYWFQDAEASLVAKGLATLA